MWFRFWESQTDHGFSFYLAHLWWCVCVCCCAWVCVYPVSLAMCGSVWDIVTLEWLGMCPLATVFWIMSRWGRSDEINQQTYHTSSDEPIGKSVCNSRASTSRGQSLCTFITIWKIQLICTKMSRFRPESIINTKYFLASIFSWKKVAELHF